MFFFSYYICFFMPDLFHISSPDVANCGCLVSFECNLTPMSPISFPRASVVLCFYTLPIKPFF